MFIAPALIERFGWQSVPQFYAAAMVVTAAIFWLLSAPDVSAPGKSGVSLRQQLAVLKDVRVWKYCQYYSIVFGGFTALSVWMPNYFVQEYGLSIAQAICDGVDFRKNDSKKSGIAIGRRITFSRVASHQQETRQFHWRRPALNAMLRFVVNQTLAIECFGPIGVERRRDRIPFIFAERRTALRACDAPSEKLTSSHIRICLARAIRTELH